eukprot:2202023-Pleurochrysis_carterae.AAC.2
MGGSGRDIGSAGLQLKGKSRATARTHEGEERRCGKTNNLFAKLHSARLKKTTQKDERLATTGSGSQGIGDDIAWKRAAETATKKAAGCRSGARHQAKSDVKARACRRACVRPRSCKRRAQGRGACARCGVARLEARVRARVEEDAPAQPAAAQTSATRSTEHVARPPPAHALPHSLPLRKSECGEVKRIE